MSIIDYETFSNINLKLKLLSYFEPGWITGLSAPARLNA